jgi:flagellar hook-length control protein FliK
MELPVVNTIPRAGPTLQVSETKPQRAESGEDSGFEAYIDKAMSADTEKQASQTSNKTETKPKEEEKPAEEALSDVLPVAVINPQVIVEMVAPVETTAGEVTDTEIAANTSSTMAVEMANSMTESQAALTAQPVESLQAEPTVAPVVEETSTLEQTVDVSQAAPTDAAEELQVSAQTSNTDAMKNISASETKPVVEKIQVVEEQPVEKTETAETETTAVYKENVVKAYSVESQPIETNKTAVMQQVNTGIKEMVQNGETSLRMQLYPEGLGRVDMHLVSGKNGTQIILSADNPSTSRLLEQNLNQLQNSLGQAGVQIGSMSVANQNQQRQPSQGSENQNKFNKTNRFNLSEWEDDSGYNLTSQSVSALAGLEYLV